MLNGLVKNLDDRGISLVITPELCQKVASDGFEPEFGARPMRRVVDNDIGDALGKAILKNEVQSGDRIKIIPSEADGYSVVKI
jgi:ATP-dependent Clp protease ATP-binding subunit ClpA